MSGVIAVWQEDGGPVFLPTPGNVKFCEALNMGQWPEQPANCGRCDSMTFKHDRDLAKSILRHAGEAAMRKQLRQMPVFAVPHDRGGNFRHLLDKLDRAALPPQPPGVNPAKAGNQP